MLRVPNVSSPADAEPVPTGTPSTLPETGGQPRPRKPYAPDDPAIADLDKPGADPDVKIPGPPLGQYGSF